MDSTLYLEVCFPPKQSASKAVPCECVCICVVKEKKSILEALQKCLLSECVWPCWRERRPVVLGSRAQWMSVTKRRPRSTTITLPLVKPPTRSRTAATPSTRHAGENRYLCVFLCEREKYDNMSQVCSTYVFTHTQ